MDDRVAMPLGLLHQRSAAELAHTADFDLGRTRVRPSILQMQRPGQAAQTLEPRAMQVLVVLAGAQGEVVSRGDLIALCWGGRVVGDNAINRIISRLRQLAGDAEDAEFEIETIPKVGYRLNLTGARPAPPAPSVGADPAPPAVAALGSGALPLQAGGSAGRRWFLGGLAGAVLAGAGWAVWQRATRQAGSLGGARLVVLPFLTEPGQSAEQLLGVGMADSLITRLSTTSGLVVRSTGSSLRHAGPTQDPIKAAIELGADWVVTGTLSRSGEQLQTTARLLRASDGTTRWSQRFDTPVSGIFDVQDLISARVVQALAAESHASVPASWGKGMAQDGGTRNAEAYQLYLAAIWRGQGHRRQDLDHALRLLEQALALDPGFAMAWVGVAWTHRRGLWIDTRPAEVFGPAEAALRRAAELAPGLAEMRAGRGFTRYWYEFDWPAAEHEFRTALSSNPNAAIAHFGLAQLLLTQGRIDEGLVHLRQTVELDPMSPVFSVVEASYLLNLGHREQGRRRLEAATALAPTLWPMHVVLGELLIAEGRAKDGLVALRRAVALGGGNSRPQAMLGVQLAALGQDDEARQLLATLQAESRTRFVPPTSLAALLAVLGQTGPAIDMLEQAVAVRDTRVIFLKDDPHWRTLRDQPRFMALLRRVGLDRFGPGLWQV